MTVSSQEMHRQVATLAFEARFDDGYRYLDLCGECLSQIRKRDLQWIPNDPNPQNGVLVHQEKKINAVFNSERIGVSRNEQEPISVLDAQKVCVSLAEEAEGLYRIVTNILRIPNTTRVGARFNFIAPAESPEDADRFLVNLPRSALCERVLTLTDSELCHAAFRYRIEEEETGYRKTINVYHFSRRKPGVPAPTGLAGDEMSSGVAVDIDTFTRPHGGHFPDVARFVQNAFSRSETLARRLFQWLQLQQGR